MRFIIDYDALFTPTSKPIVPFPTSSEAPNGFDCVTVRAELEASSQPQARRDLIPNTTSWRQFLRFSMSVSPASTPVLCTFFAAGLMPIAVAGTTVKLGQFFDLFAFVASLH